MIDGAVSKVRKAWRAGSISIIRSKTAGEFVCVGKENLMLTLGTKAAFPAGAAAGRFLNSGRRNGKIGTNEVTIVPLKKSINVPEL